MARHFQVVLFKLPNDQSVSEARSGNTYILLSGKMINATLASIGDITTLPGGGAKHAQISDEEESASAEAQELNLSSVCVSNSKKASVAKAK